MRLIKIKLGYEGIIWTLGDLVLNVNNRESPLIDFDELTEYEKNIIENSKRIKEITIENENNEEIKNFEEKVLNEKCISVDIDDLDEENLEDIQCITVTEDDDFIADNNTIEYIEDKEIENTKVINEAHSILKKNGNTVKRIISELDMKNDYFYNLIKACYNIEGEKQSPRKSIIKEIKRKLDEFKN